MLDQFGVLTCLHPQQAFRCQHVRFEVPRGDRSPEPLCVDLRAAHPPPRHAK